jgi:mono/diheme cytochrome c family protein
VDERSALRLKWALGAVAALLIIEVAVTAQQILGGFDSTALQGYSEPVSWVIHRTMIESVRRRAKTIQPPPRFSQADVRAGFRLYDQRCVTCHGAPGIGRQTWVTGMHPAPPYLLDAAKHWRARELDLIVSDGVKMTGMPGWRTTLSRGDIWSLVAFLESMPGATAANYARLRQEARTPPSRYGCMSCRSLAHPGARVRFADHRR